MAGRATVIGELNPPQQGAACVEMLGVVREKLKQKDQQLLGTKMNHEDYLGIFAARAALVEIEAELDRIYGKHFRV